MQVGFASAVGIILFEVLLSHKLKRYLSIDSEKRCLLQVQSACCPLARCALACCALALRAGPLRADPLRTLARCALARCVLAVEQQGCINKLANNGPMLCLDISEFATGFVHGETNQFT